MNVQKTIRPLEVFESRLRLQVPVEVAFEWHQRPGALSRLTPPWSDVEVLEAPATPEPGSRAVLRVPVGPFKMKWVAEHTEFVPGRLFRDVALSGPFGHWDHTHEFLPEGPDACVLVDRILYAAPFGRLGAFFGSAHIRRELSQVFAYRSRILTQDLHRYQVQSAPSDLKETRPMKILITGSNGLVGSSLVPFLTSGGHQVVRLVRRAARSPDEAQWDPDSGLVDLEVCESAEALIHLAGASIAEGRWSTARKQLIRSSRVDATQRLCESLSRLREPPKAFVSASAIGVYGDQGAAVLDEQSPPGAGFLADVVRDWEDASSVARLAGLRVVNLRFGVILDPRGGALKKMLLPFKLGAGGRLGSGQQYMSWVALDDVLAAILHALKSTNLSGALNVVSPQAVTNATYTRALGKALRRPTLFPVPGIAARLAFGEMANELLLSSQRVAPKQLLDSGFEFAWPEINQALAHMLGRVDGPGTNQSETCSSATKNMGNTARGA
jgi:uncharacterized protein